MLPELLEKKRRGEPIVMVTAYNTPTAEAAEAAGVDLVLAGDTASTTALGHERTAAVSFDEMLLLTQAVRRGLRTPLLVGDLPFGSYERSHEQAIASAQRFVKEAGCDAVKFEGPDAARARAIADSGIPVMGHLGLTPQTARDFLARARTGAAARRLLDDSLALEQAGCFAVVFEAVPAKVAAVVTEQLSIPTIGIGAGPDTSGQVLVLNDLLGIFDEFEPRFVKRYAHIRRDMTDAVGAYADDVRAGGGEIRTSCEPRRIVLERGRVIGVETRAGDRFLLCSDGLSNLVENEEIRDALAEADLAEVPALLIDLANARGGDDNITVVAVQRTD
jgi:3-methyl-2-oxobutanoate hydroxymethyltransferase